MAFPETATVILCVCQHAELGVSLAGHHRAHPAQPIARNPLRGAPQAPRPLRSTDETSPSFLWDIHYLHVVTDR